MKIKILLASNSPRRKEILKREGYDIEVIASIGEINIVGKKYNKELVESCAICKAKASYDNYVNLHKNNCFILVSADTIVACDNIIYGKPKDKNEAFKMLKSLVGKSHIVCSAVCIIKDENILVGSEETKVFFKNASDEEILKYLEKEKPYDKAGSYGIQDKYLTFKDRIEGSYDNVVGFPIDKFKELYKKYEMEEKI